MAERNGGNTPAPNKPQPKRRRTALNLPANHNQGGGLTKPPRGGPEANSSQSNAHQSIAHAKLTSKLASACQLCCGSSQSRRRCMQLAGLCTCAPGRSVHHTTLNTRCTTQNWDLVPRPCTPAARVRVRGAVSVKRLGHASRASARHHHSLAWCVRSVWNGHMRARPHVRMWGGRQTTRNIQLAMMHPQNENCRHQQRNTPRAGCRRPRAGQGWWRAGSPHPLPHARPKRQPAQR
jgi:hypothetical protein